MSGLPLVRPEWPVTGVGAAMSTRAGGVSQAPWASLNLGRKVGDETAAVAENRRRFVAALDGARPVWPRHCHGIEVCQLTGQTPEDLERDVDATWTTERNVACMVGAADCMPVLVAAADGHAVGAAHAGWRGLAAGVVEALLGALARGASVRPGELHVWLGPCIGAAHFEVGADVLAAFGAEPLRESQLGFAFTPRADGALRWRADLPALAEARLRRAGVGAVWRSQACTHGDADRFFSYRRDGLTGRMVAAIWRR